MHPPPPLQSYTPPPNMNFTSIHFSTWARFVQKRVNPRHGVAFPRTGMCSSRKYLLPLPQKGFFFFKNPHAMKISIKLHRSFYLLFCLTESPTHRKFQSLDDDRGGGGGEVWIFSETAQWPSFLGLTVDVMPNHLYQLKKRWWSTQPSVKIDLHASSTVQR